MTTGCYSAGERIGAMKSVMWAMRQRASSIQLDDLVAELMQHRFPQDLANSAARQLVDAGELYFTGSGLIALGPRPEVLTFAPDWKSKFPIEPRQRMEEFHSDREVLLSAIKQLRRVFNEDISGQVDIFFFQIYYGLLQDSNITAEELGVSEDEHQAILEGAHDEMISWIEMV